MLNDKKRTRILTAANTAMMMLAMTSIAMAGGRPGLENGLNWITGQLGIVVLIATIGLAILFFFQKATAKMIVTIVVGSFVYMLTRSPEAILGGLGKFIQGLLGL